MTRAVGVIFVLAAALPALMGGCGERRSDERSSKATAPPATAVPIVGALRPHLDHVTCPRPTRCVRALVVSSSGAASDDALAARQEAMLRKRGWRRVPPCGSPVAQYESRNVEVFVTPGRIARDAAHLSRRVREAIRRRGDREAVVVLQLADAAPAAPCSR